MTATLPSLTNLKPNPAWASLPLFDRTGWKRVRFGDVVENCAETCDPEEEGLERFVAMEHLEPGSLHVRSWGNVADGTTFTRWCRPGQVLFGKRRAYQRKVAVAEFEAVVSGDIYVLAPKDAQRLLPELLPFLCLSERFFQHAVGTSAGSLSPRTNWSSLASFEFDLPPLEQQRRIAELLVAQNSTLQSWVVLHQSAVTYRNSLGEKYFSPLKCGNAKGGSVVRLKEVCSLIKDGTHLPPPRTMQGPLLLGAANILGGELRLTDNDTRISEAFFDGMHKSWKLEVGDVLLSIIGTVGRTALVPLDFPKFTIHRNVAVLRGKDDLLHNGYLRHFLESSVGQRRMTARVNQTAQAALYLGEINRVEIPLPTLKEQVRISNEFDSIDKIIGSSIEHQRRVSEVMSTTINSFC